MNMNMKNNVLVTLLLLAIATLAIQPVWTYGKSLNASQILGKVDNVMNAPKDQDQKLQMVVSGRRGGSDTREMRMIQKGSDKRIARFLSPADKRGIAFLSLPGDVIYLYLPAFKKNRRIASHVKNTSFAGTDFTFEDMEAKKYSQKYNPKLLRTEKKHFVLQLMPKAGLKTDYSKLIMWVRKDNYYPTKIEHYDRGGKLRKILTLKPKKFGKYWASGELKMDDLKKGSSTRMNILNAKFDSSLPDKLFTKRYLKK